MSKLIALCDGHGKDTPGKRTPPIPELGGRVIYENEFNKEVVKFLDIELKRCGFKTLLVAPTDYDTSLKDRVNKANQANADAYISCHYNAGGGVGVETYHYPSSSQGKKLAECIHKHVKGGTPQKDRGVKTANFYVLKYTNMPAALIEYGFMDDPNFVEAKRMLDPAFQKECAVETTQGICEYFGVTYNDADVPKEVIEPKNSAPKPSAPKPTIKYPGFLTKYGSRGTSVKQIQRALGGLVVDGIFGSKTEQAVKAFQRKHKLYVDGVVGPASWRKLFG